jgi:hypothetical protein
MNASQVASRQRGSASESARRSDAVARPAASLGKVTLQDHAQTPLELPLARAGLVRQPESSREVAQKLEQGQIGPGGRFDSVRRRFGDGDCSAGNGGPEHGLELPEARLALDHAAR